MQLQIPELSLVLLIGPSGAGKSTFARRHFKPTEVLSSDACRAMVSDDENDQAVSREAFEVLHAIAARRLALGRLTVVDATSVRPEDRKPLVELARAHHCLPVAIVFDLPERICQEHNRGRSDRAFGPHVIRGQLAALRRSLRGLKREGFSHVHLFKTVEDVEAAVVERTPLYNNKKDELGPFDIIGDVHGCFDELVELLAQLGFEYTGPAGAWSHPQGRKLIFLGDLVDRGPKIPEVVRLVMDSVAAGSAMCVPGNHDVKFMRAVWGKNVQIAHGLAESLEQFSAYEEHYRGFSRITAEFIDSLISHYVLDGGRLVVAHAGMKQEMQGRGSRAVREFALYGETTGETDEFGLPVRYEWAAEYRGKAAVVYGHTPVPQPQWFNNTVCIDTGCVFGGSLTALRWPEREFASVPAKATYAQPRKPFLPPQDGASLSLQQRNDDVLDLEDVFGKRHIQTRLQRTIVVRQENAAAALEIMSRFAADPRWLIYLPPTMSPTETSREPGLLEHPREAFEHYRTNGVGRVICEEKHMGSRAVVIVCRERDVVRQRFGIGQGAQSAAAKLSSGADATTATGSSADALGMIYTRTGRPFFNDGDMERAMLRRVADAVASAGLWDELQTDWLCLDCELMPWSAKAQGLIREQYAAVGAGARAGLGEAVAALERTHARLIETGDPPRAPVIEAGDLLAEARTRLELVNRYVEAYRRYCWDVRAIDDLRLAPFHLLAAEGRTFFDRDHAWHMETLARLAGAGDPVFVATPFKLVDLSSEPSEREATDWWRELTARGGEGMVVKPLDFIARGPRGWLQPALKVRGSEYLRIIYGPEYTLPRHLERLRSRGLAGKRSLALREFALGVESLDRFIRREPLRRVHECVFAVLAMESEPVDPRL